MTPTFKAMDMGYPMGSPGKCAHPSLTVLMPLLQWQRIQAPYLFCSTMKKLSVIPPIFWRVR